MRNKCEERTKYRGNLPTHIRLRAAAVLELDVFRLGVIGLVLDPVETVDIQREKTAQEGYGSKDDCDDGEAKDRYSDDLAVTSLLDAGASLLLAGLGLFQVQLVLNHLLNSNGIPVNLGVLNRSGGFAIWVP